mmetsp:Transcript_33918/g.41767  ORF Transcript_33918/g.41767 Transcript_33918/m.41767 type:complete len:181 (+) Transcript_33918:51-593(+)
MDPLFLGTLIGIIVGSLGTYIILSQFNAKNKTESKRKKVLVSGCFDLLHSGHIKFFEEASKYGNLYVRLGTDKNIELLKHHKPMFPENERLYMVKNIKYVYNAELSAGTGVYDFEEDMRILKPDIYFVNEDASKMDGRVKICKKYGIQYVCKPREPEQGLTKRSSTSIKATINDKNKSKK